VGSGPDDSLLLVLRNRTVRVPAWLLEVRHERPNKFTVVRLPRGNGNAAGGTTKDLGRMYAVCPASGHRIRLFGEPSQLECPGCGYRGEVAWLETG
jgi:hypothetical protein